MEAGLEHDPDDVWAAYADPRRDPWRALALPVLRRRPVADVAQVAVVSERRLRDLLAEQARPNPRTDTALARVAVAFARMRLRASGLSLPAGVLATCAAYPACAGEG